MNNQQYPVSNVFRIIRENLNLTREQASEKITCITAAKLEKIENDKVQPHPDDVICLAKGYNCPELIQHYCCHMCEIGKSCAPYAGHHSLNEIITNLLGCSEYIERNRPLLTKLISSKEVASLSESKLEIDPNDLLTVLSVLNSECLSLAIWLNQPGSRFLNTQKHNGRVS